MYAKHYVLKVQSNFSVPLGSLLLGVLESSGKAPAAPRPPAQPVVRLSLLSVTPFPALTDKDEDPLVWNIYTYALELSLLIPPETGLIQSAYQGTGPGTVLSSCLQYKDTTHIQMHLSVDPKALRSLHQLAWDLLVGLSFLRLSPSEKHTQPSLVAVSILGSQAAYPTFCLVQLGVHQRSPTGDTLCDTPSVILSLAVVAGTTDTWAPTTCGPHSSCWHRCRTDACDPHFSLPTRMQNREPLIQEQS